MAKIGVADYGMYVWYGGLYDYEDRIDAIHEIGYDGLERLTPSSAEDALVKAAMLKKKGMGFATCNASPIENSIKWTAALGAKYVWAASQASTFDAYIRQINEQIKVCAKYGLDVVLHNHLGSKAETQEQVETILKECPGLKLLFDTGHLAVAGGDLRYIADTYYDRIAAYHLKGWQTSETPDAAAWHQRGHFCGLGQGDFFVDNEYVAKKAFANGFDGWVMIEHDTHLREPLLDLKDSYDILMKWKREAEA